MTNAELIKALRNCSDGFCSLCPYDDYELSTKECEAKLMLDAADALEAAENRIEELESQAAFFDAEKLNYQENIEYRDERIKELEAQLPKEAHWIAVENGHGVCSNCNRQDSIDNMATHCRYCGAKMRGEQEETKCKE